MGSTREEVLMTGAAGAGHAHLAEEVLRDVLRETTADPVLPASRALGLPPSWLSWVPRSCAPSVADLETPPMRFSTPQ
jgi:hypothetical protein